MWKACLTVVSRRADSLETLINRGEHIGANVVFHVDDERMNFNFVEKVQGRIILGVSLSETKKKKKKKKKKNDGNAAVWKFIWLLLLWKKIENYGFSDVITVILAKIIISRTATNFFGLIMSPVARFENIFCRIEKYRRTWNATYYFKQR